MADKNDIKKSEVSILVVSYNAEKHIKKTVRSCLNQTYENIEILLLDNDSKDKTLEIIERIRAKDKRLKIFKSKENLGPYKGFNSLLEKAKGDYIAIQDHDDIWFPEKIEKQVEFLEKNKDFIACGTNTFYFYESKNILILNKKPFITDFVDHTSLMFRNKNFRYDDNYVLTDEHFEKKILAKKGKIACLQDALTIHRIKGDGTNLSSSRFKISLKNIKEFFSINKLSFQNLLYLLDLLVGRFLPNDLLWIIRKKITQKNNIWINLKDFSLKYPEIKL